MLEASLSSFSESTLPLFLVGDLFMVVRPRLGGRENKGALTVLETGVSNEVWATRGPPFFTVGVTAPLPL